ncbi:Mrpl16p [Malassezia vespertilionis]|uniref:Mrpl16p n=1 Tax=Malassezia vespertilionis TaxID=2020962 RepID=A0A2N1JGN6_9BASI|nr:Mrpl16p [Malassezia vespertilionis]
MSFRSMLTNTRPAFANLSGPVPKLHLPTPASQFLLYNNVPAQRRLASNLGPRRGSVKGTTITQGIYGIRALEPSRISATQLTAAETALKRKLKLVRGSQVFMRVFPDIPVCVKGNETRMGKGKGTFEFWACRVPVGKVLFEIGGHFEVREEVAKEAAKLPIRTEFITKNTPPRLGREVSSSLIANMPTRPEDMP